jgi:ATP-dependent Lon protease
VLAAHRAGIKSIVLPDKNRKDKPDIPEEILKDVELIFVQRMNEALEAALEPATGPSPERPDDSLKPASDSPLGQA